MRQGIKLEKREKGKFAFDLKREKETCETRIWQPIWKQKDAYYAIMTLSSDMVQQFDAL